jgi:hypothetical protein
MAFPQKRLWYHPDRGFIELKITETEIFQKTVRTKIFTREREGDYVSVFKVSTPFREDEIPTSITMCTKGDVDVDVYIKEVKSRREKNDRIEELEKQLFDKFDKEKLVKVLKEKVLKQDSQFYELINQRDTLNTCITELKSCIENVTYERDTFAKRLFEVTEELTSLKQIYDRPVLVAEVIPNVYDLNAQIQSLKLQLATEKRISQKYARDLEEKRKTTESITAM